MPKFKCKKVEADAMDSASWKFINSCELDGNPSQIFPLLVDGVNWAKWFKVSIHTFTFAQKETNKIH